MGGGGVYQGECPLNACESAVLSLSAGRTPCVGKCETCPVVWEACRDGASHAELAECGCIYSSREEEMGMVEIVCPDISLCLHLSRG